MPPIQKKSYNTALKPEIRFRVGEGKSFCLCKVAAAACPRYRRIKIFPRKFLVKNPQRPHFPAVGSEGQTTQLAGLRGQPDDASQLPAIPNFPARHPFKRWILAQQFSNFSEDEHLNKGS